MENFVVYKIGLNGTEMTDGKFLKIEHYRLPSVSAVIGTEIPAWGFAFWQQWQARATNGSSLPAN